MSDSNNFISKLSDGLLQQFSSFREIEKMLTQLLEKQNEMLDKDIQQLDFYQNDEQLLEVSLMMKKMNLYRLKINQLRSEMLYIHQRVKKLKEKSLEIQNYKAEERIDRIKRYDYEQGLIAKSVSVKKL